MDREQMQQMYGSVTRANQLQNGDPVTSYGRFGAYVYPKYYSTTNVPQMQDLINSYQQYQQRQPTMDDYINQMENENSAAWQYSGGGRTEPLMPNVRQGGNVLYELLQSVFNDRGNNLSQFGREQSIRNTLARDGIY